MATNGNGNGSTWRVIIAVLSCIGFTGAGWLSLNREVAVTCQRAERNEQEVQRLTVDLVLVREQQAAYNATVNSIDKRLEQIEAKLNRGAR